MRLRLGPGSGPRILPILTINLSRSQEKPIPVTAPFAGSTSRTGAFQPWKKDGNVHWKHEVNTRHFRVWQFGCVPETDKHDETCKIMMKAKHVEISTLSVSWQISGCRSPISSKITPTHFFPTEQKLTRSSCPVGTLSSNLFFLIGCVFSLHPHISACFFCLVKSPYLCLSQIRMPWKRGLILAHFLHWVEAHGHLAGLGNISTGNHGFSSQLWDLWRVPETFLPPFPGTHWEKEHEMIALGLLATFSSALQDWN